MYFDCRVVNCIPIASFGLTSPFDGKLAFRDARTVNPVHSPFHDPTRCSTFSRFVNDVPYYCDSVVQPLLQSWSTELSLSDVRM